MMAPQTENVPILPSRGRVLLPGLTLRVKVGRSNTVRLVEEKVIERLGAKSTSAGSGNKNNNSAVVLVGIVPVKNEGSAGTAATQVGGPESSENLHTTGCLARVLRVERLTNGEVTYNLVIEGVSRFRVLEYTQQTPYLMANVQRVSEPTVDKKDTEFEASVAQLRQIGREMLDVLKEFHLPQALVAQMRRHMDTTPPGLLADLLMSMIDVSLAEKLDILDTIELKPRVAKTITLVKRQMQLLKMTQEVQSTVESKLNKKQRESYLRQQLKQIKDELNEKDDEQEEDEVAELQKRIDEAQLPEEPEKAASRELKRMKKMNPSQPEYSVIRSYLEVLADIPWTVSSPTVVDVDKARIQLDEDHYGLDKIKRRILEYLAVRKLKQDMRGPILCFVGPPGVGKTSLGQSIAHALGRKFHRISLGGVHDEAEIRGHRRTYIGSMPGRIVQALRKTGVNNPVLMLDEIDKLGQDYRGDPAAALLEVLDPEQNSSFSDHYLNVSLDLSKVLFIATANDLEKIPAPLLDRMELIRLPGYTFEEKCQIARRYLLAKQLRAHGLQPDQVEISDEVLNKIAVSYTRESGVRTLEREIAAVCRSVAVEMSSAATAGKVKTVTAEDIVAILGPEPFEDDIVERTATTGVAVGLAWTSVGGGILFIEATKMPGTGKLTLTGTLGNVIKESAEAALSWVRSNSYALGLDQRGNVSLLDKTDIHIHFPAGATPKDGPSAGVTITTALVSLLTNQTTRPHTAMTGEITLRGLVLPVGGIKEKVLAAHRAGIKRIIIPFRNKKDLQDVPKNVQDGIEFVFAKRITDVLSAAFNSNLFRNYDSLPISHL